MIATHKTIHKKSQNTSMTLSQEELEQEINAALLRHFPHLKPDMLSSKYAVEPIDVSYPFNGVQIKMIYEVRYLEHTIPPLYITQNMTPEIREEEIQNWLWWLKHNELGESGV